jgi:hypothetical protein
MAEYLLSVIAYDNIHSQSQYVLITLITFITVIIYLSFIGQKTRIYLPMTHSKTRCLQQAEIDLITVKKKTGYGLVRPEIVVKKTDSVYREFLPRPRT